MRIPLMTTNAKRMLVLGAIALVAGAGYATVAAAQSQQTPKGWSYEIRDGKRVPKGNRVTNPDGSWREEVRQGNCVTVKEKSAAGEYKETRQCNGGCPSHRAESPFRPLPDLAFRQLAHVHVLAVPDLCTAVGPGEDRPVAGLLP